jgi:hypothetical protein
MRTSRGIALLLLVLLLVAAPAVAQSPPDLPPVVTVAVGGSVNLCKARLAFCPVGGFMCDDPKVAVILNEKDGAEVRGVGTGTTLCATFGVMNVNRRVIKVVVGGAAPRPK